MPSPIYTLTVTGEFSASHQLRNFGGRCEHLHGHNFGVEVTVTGRELDPETGLLMDFGIIKKALARVLAGLDHKHLNDVEPFTEINPSSENIARHIYNELSGVIASQGPELSSVTVSESPRARATYSEG